MTTRGFSLIEVIIATALVATTVGSLFAVGALSVRLTTLNEDRLLASQLAREGVEIARVIRNDNFVRSRASCTTATCEAWDWRDGLVLTPAERELLANGSVLARQIDEVAGRPVFALTEGGMSPESPCTDYIHRETLAIRHGSLPDEPHHYFCRRTFIEPVREVTISGHPIAGETGPVLQSENALRVRSQVAWLGQGRGSFMQKSPDNLACNDEGTEWCTEQVTLLTNWRPTL